MRDMLCTLILGASLIAPRLALADDAPLAPSSPDSSSGPASPAPAGLSPPSPQASPAPLVQVEAPRVRLHFDSDTPGAVFHVRTSTTESLGIGMLAAPSFPAGGYTTFAAWTYPVHLHGYTSICEAPCDATLPAGTYAMAVSQRGGEPVEAKQVVEITGPSAVRGTYVSRSGIRIAGWIIGGVSFAAGMSMLVVGGLKSTHDCSVSPCVDRPSSDAGMMLAGAGVIVGGSIVTVVMALQHDSATVTVTTIDAATQLSIPTARRESAWATPSGASAPGLGVVLRM